MSIGPEGAAKAKALLGVQALGAAAELAGVLTGQAEAATISPQDIHQELNTPKNPNVLQVSDDFGKPPVELVDLPDQPGGRQSPIVWEKGTEPTPTPTPEKAPGLASPLEGGVEGVDYVKVAIKSGDINPEMKLVAGEGVAIRDEKSSSYDFVKVDEQMVFLNPGEELDVYEVKEQDGQRYALVRRPDNWDSLPQDQRAVAVWLGSSDTPSQITDEQGKVTGGHQLWERKPVDISAPTAVPVVDGEGGMGGPIEIDKEFFQTPQLAKDGISVSFQLGGNRIGQTKADTLSFVIDAEGPVLGIGRNGEVFVKVKAADGNALWISNSAFDALQGLTGLNSQALKDSGFKIEADLSVSKPELPASDLVDLTGFVPAEQAGIAPSVNDQRTDFRKRAESPLIGKAGPIKSSRLTGVGFIENQGGRFYGRIVESWAKPGTNELVMLLDAFPQPDGTIKRCYVVFPDTRETVTFWDVATDGGWHYVDWGFTAGDIQRGDYVMINTKDNVAGTTPEKVIGHGIDLSK